jgi:putative Mg2+ transporter-C (MgtC) family protein
MDNILVKNLLKVGMAVLVGGLIGAEREFQDKAAGFRTIILITVGSSLFTIFSMSMDPDNSRTRIAANIVTGIGFLGAGAIVREHGRISGLTTAATIWLSSALGMGIGAGELAFVSIATVVVLTVLFLFPYLEQWIDQSREARSYKIVISSTNIKGADKIKVSLQSLSLRMLSHHQTKTEDAIIGTWHVIGSPKNHEKFVDQMVKDKSIKELTY